MRIAVWKKDDYFHNTGSRRLDMDPSVVVLPEGRIPIAWSFVFDKNPYGWFSDVRLEDGEITGEVEFTNPAFLVEEDAQATLDGFGCRLGGYYVDVQQDAGRVLGCELKGISVMLLSQTPGWPKKE